MAKWREVEIEKRDDSLGEILVSLVCPPAALFLSDTPSYRVVYENEHGHRVEGWGKTIEEARQDAARKLY